MWPIPGTRQANDTLLACPANGPHGQFPKAWRRTTHGLELWKAGSESAANAGFEPYAEYLVSQLAAKVGIPAVSYRLARWKDKLASVCTLMNSKNAAFVPFYTVTGLASFPEILAGARAISDGAFRAMRDMLVFDALIVNQDRHANNYGLLRDNATGHVLGPAPLVDHNMALFKDDMRSDWEAGAWSPDTMNRLQPANSRLTFLGQARQIMGADQHTWLRRALDVTLEDDPDHPIEPDHLAALNTYLHATARHLLELPVIDKAALTAQLNALAPSIADAPVLRNEALLDTVD